MMQKPYKKRTVRLTKTYLQRLLCCEFAQRFGFTWFEALNAFHKASWQTISGAHRAMRFLLPNEAISLAGGDVLVHPPPSNSDRWLIEWPDHSTESASEGQIFTMMLLEALDSGWSIVASTRQEVLL